MFDILSKNVILMSEVLAVAYVIWHPGYSGSTRGLDKDPRNKEEERIY